MKVIVERQPAQHPGPDIIESLLSTPAGAIERGRAAIDQAAASQRTSHTVLFRDGQRCGNLIEVRDATQGATWRGQVVAITINGSGSGAEATTTEEIRRA